MKKHMKILIDLILFNLWDFQQYITVLSWRSVLLAEYQEKTIDLSQVTDKLYQILYRVHLALAMFEITLVAIGTGCIANYKSNYHTITDGFQCFSIFSFLCSALYIIICPYSFDHCIVCPSIASNYPFGTFNLSWKYTEMKQVLGNNTTQLFLVVSTDIHSY